MTDDEMALSVQEGLAGIRRCPQCGGPMRRDYRLHRMANWTAPRVQWGWFHGCANPNDPFRFVFVADDD